MGVRTALKLCPLSCCCCTTGTPTLTPPKCRCWRMIATRARPWRCAKHWANEPGFTIVTHKPTSKDSKITVSTCCKWRAPIQNYNHAGPPHRINATEGCITNGETPIQKARRHHNQCRKAPHTQQVLMLPRQDKRKPLAWLSLLFAF